MRRQGLDALIGRHSLAAPDSADEVGRVLHVLTSFETFDALAAADRRCVDVVPTVMALAGSVVHPPPERQLRRASRRGTAGS
jgi:hypothetical protein